MSAVYWVNKCRGAKKPRGGVLTPMLGCLEIRSDWRCRARHKYGVSNTLADGISRWPRNELPYHLQCFRPDIGWHEEDLGRKGMAIITAVSGSHILEAQLQSRLNETIRQLSGLWSYFMG